MPPLDITGPAGRLEALLEEPTAGDRPTAASAQDTLPVCARRWCSGIR